MRKLVVLALGAALSLSLMVPAHAGERNCYEAPEAPCAITKVVARVANTDVAPARNANAGYLVTVTNDSGVPAHLVVTYLKNTISAHAVTLVTALVPPGTSTFAVEVPQFRRIDGTLVAKVFCNPWNADDETVTLERVA